MYVYRILLPSETDDSRFNSREKHMLKYSIPTNFKSIWLQVKFLQNFKTNEDSTDR